MADDDLLCDENISDVASTPAAGNSSPGDGDLFADVSFKYGGTDVGGEGEFVRFLAEKETAHGCRVGQSVDFDEWVRGVRTEAIDWILNTRASLGLRWKTAHLAVTLYDRFLSVFSIEQQKQWAARLLQIACLSLAAKMEEITAPSLASYQVDDVNVGCEAITRMEMHVLTQLGFLLNTPTPFDYIPCFMVAAAEVCPPMETVSRIVKLVFALTRGVNLRNHRPSSIAIAAIMAGMDQKLDEDAVVGRLNSFAYVHLLDVGNVVECYNLMKNLDVEERRESSVIVSPDLSPGRCNGSNGVGGSSSISLSNGKRRRLDFDRPPDP